MKEQAASITKEKVEEICKLIPGFKNEIDWRPGKSRSSKDTVTYVFKNGSVLDIVAARQSSRGRRKHGGLMEECILIDGTLLNEIIIPRFVGLYNVSYFEKQCERKTSGVRLKRANGEESRTPCQASDS